jgi:hypothetical protein
MGLQFRLSDLENYSLRIKSCYSLPQNHDYTNLDLLGISSCYTRLNLEVHDYLIEDSLDLN